MCDYQEQYNKFNSYSQKFSRMIGDWRTQTFMISLGALGVVISGGSLIIGLGGSTVAVLPTLFSKKVETDKEKSLHYIQKINNYIELKVYLEGLRPYLLGCRLPSDYYGKNRPKIS